jgi:hypothetical protein
LIYKELSLFITAVDIFPAYMTRHCYSLMMRLLLISLAEILPADSGK